MGVALADTSAAYGAVFGFDTNKITIIEKYNIINKFELKSKEEAARDILDKIVALLKS